MDINHCIDHLGLNRNTYRLTQSATPHEFISWDGPDAQPTQEELETAWTQIQTAYDNDYARKRSAEYPSIVDQLDKIYHDGINEWKKVIKATKDKYPKS
mgnify:FL=1